MESASRLSSYSPPSKVVICGGGLHGCALAYYLTKAGHGDVTVIECRSVAAEASGKGGGFLARDWGNGTTAQLHKVSFALHEELAKELSIASFRRLPVLSVVPGRRSTRTVDLCPWLDGDIRNSQMMSSPDGAAQVTPLELCTKLMDAAVAQGAKLVIGTVEGVATTAASAGAIESVAGVVVDGATVEADAVVVTMGPWSSLAQDWFKIKVPIAGIRSTSIVFKAPEKQQVAPYALFCQEDERGTHLEVYPRASGEIYLCGLGGSEEVSPDRLRAGAYPPGQVPPDPKRVAAATATFSEMSRALGKSLPDVEQACMRPLTPDGLPLMGKVGHLKGAYISAGHNCWGILWAPVSGKAMAELVLEGRAHCVDLSPFSPGRLMAEAGGRGRKRGTQPVGEQW